MRKVRAATFVSLDGTMQAPGGPQEDPAGGFRFGGWTFHFFDDVIGGALGETFDRPFDLLLGRRTYEIFAAHWPHAGDDPIAKAFNACTKYVATRSDRRLDWENSVAIHDAAAEVEALKRGDGPDLLIQGSSDLLQTLLRARLVDEFTVLTFPVVLGSGKRLFGEGVSPGALDLTGVRVSTTGVIIADYRLSGEVPVGSFAHEEPSAEELARREAWAREG